MQLVGAREAISYSPKEVANMCGVKVGTVYAWISRKELRSYKIGPSRLVPADALAQMYSARKNGEFIDYTYAGKGR